MKISTFSTFKKKKLFPRKLYAEVRYVSSDCDSYDFSLVRNGLAKVLSPTIYSLGSLLFFLAYNKKLAQTLAQVSDANQPTVLELRCLRANILN